MNSNSAPLSLNPIPDYSYDHNPFLYFEDALLHGSSDFGYDEWWPMTPLQSYSQAPFMEFQSFDDIWGDFGMWDQSFPQVYGVANNDNVVDVKPLISVPRDTAAFDGNTRIHQSGALAFDGHARIHQVPVDKENFHQSGAISAPGAMAFDGLTHIHQTQVEEEIFPQNGTISARGATLFDGHAHIHQVPIEKERLYQSGAIIAHGDMAYDEYARIRQVPMKKESLGQGGAIIVHGDMAFDGYERIHQTPMEVERFHQGGVMRYSAKSSGLRYEEIRKYFDVPISTAAKELKVGVTVLKKRCRELNIRRWPHRKIKSLAFLIQNAKELGLTSEVATLEEHKRMIHKIPELELSERTKKLRQACFKANYKMRRAHGMAAACQNY